MADSGGKLLLDALTKEEYDTINEEIRLKIEMCINTTLEDYITAKAVFESKKSLNDDKIKTLCNELAAVQKERSDCANKWEALKDELTEVQLKYETANLGIEKYQDAIKKSESEALEYRRQRDMAIDERDEAVKMIERRDIELQRLKEDVTTLSSQLQAAISAKCEAMSNADEVHSQKLSLEYKEKRLDQEKALLNQQIQSLSEDLAKRTEDLTNMRRESTNNLIMLRTQLSEKTEELKVSIESNKQLTQSNLALNNRIENLTKKLLGQSSSESVMTENYRQEIKAQTKLAELYKGLSEDAACKNEELTTTVKDLQRLLQEATEHCGDAETKLLEKQEEFQSVLEKKNECIQELKRELEHANELIKVAKQENLENAIEAMSPAAAATSRLLKSGFTLTQIYSQYASVSEQLLLEKEENRKLNLYITTILQELEQKAPILKKQREDYDYAMNTVEQMTVRLEEMEAETTRLRQESIEAQENSSYLTRENKRHKENITDLARQVCYLLKEVEESRGGTIDMSRPSQQLRADLNTSADIISKKLVTFADIQELQLNNQKLIAVVRELSDKQEKAEQDKDSEVVRQLEHKLKLAEQRLEQYKENEVHHAKALELIKGQREMYRTMYHQQVAGKSGNSNKMDITESEAPIQTPAQSPERKPSLGDLTKINELEKKLKEKEQELTNIKKEYDSYRVERNTNEKMLNETLEKLRDDARKNSITMSELVAKAEYSEEKFKTLQGNAAAYKAQIAALEQKINIYVTTIAKHEQSIDHLKNEAVSANNKLSRAEVLLDNLKREHQILKDSEGRMTKERELMFREKQMHSSLMASIESIKVSVERSELEGKIRLETRLDEAQKECSALRRRLQEEQERFREKVEVLERSTQLARTRLDEEKDLASKVRKELNDTRDQLKQSKALIDQLNAKVRMTAHKVVPDPETEKRAMFLEQQLSEKDGEILCLKEQVATAKQSAQEYYEISQSVEKQMDAINGAFKKYKEETESMLATNSAKEAELKTVVAELQGRLASLSSAHKESASNLGGKLRTNLEELSSATAELSTLKEELERVRAELDVSQRDCRAAEEKYAHEITVHAEHIMTLTSVKNELKKVTDRVNDLETERNRAVEALTIEQESCRNREEALQAEMNVLNNRIKELNSQNDLLHDQLQALGLKMSVVQSQADASSSSLDTSFAEDDTRNSDQLLKVMKYLRTEKNIAITQLEGLKAENLRLKAQAELVGKQLEEAREMLAAERDTNDVSLITTAKHDELLRKVETLNALTDSNRTLREERDRLITRVAQLEQGTERIESEVIAPIKEQITKLTNQVELLTTENTALRGDGNRWRQRANALIEKANKNSPEDFKRLTLEKENLAKQLLNEKEECKKVLNQEKSKFDEQMKKQIQAHKEELTNLQQSINKLQKELSESKTDCEKKAEELAKLNHEFNAQEATLTDIRNKELQIRQIAKKYKTQYQELVKSNEEEKKKEAAVAEISPEVQERYKEEGRREAENSQSEKLRELTEQVTTLQAEAAALRKENEALRVNSADKEERAKVLLKNARNRILLLTEDKKNLTKEMNENKARLEAADRNKEVDAKLRRIEKEKADLVAEKERLAREVEMLTQRVNLLQRQLDKQQGSKPSTSSGLTEKSNVEPPTANIKPMAGPSTSGSKQQASQHSVTVTPWRGGGGETPFASIRPMSLQSRTVAVLPTTNQSNQGQAVLVPPQVHTSTGVEGLSSSPTSSHTDYMPATSSAIVVIRPSAIPPAQQPPPSAESTQDMEAECGEGSQAQGGLQSPGAPQSVPSTQALSIAMVLPQPTIQAQAQVQLANAENSSVVSASNQEQTMEQSVVSASNHMPTASGDQSFVSGSSGSQQQMCSTVPAYYRQVEMEEPIQSVASSHTTGTGEQSIVASSESQAEPSGSGTVVSSHSPAEQSVAAVAASSHANSSNTVTTTQAGPGSKRPRDNSTPAEDEGAKSAPAAKRSRVMIAAGTSATEAGEMLLRADGLEVEYQVPTSSQRDQEDDIILVDSEEEEEEEDEEGLPDDGGMEDGQDFEEEPDNEEGYEMESYSRDDENNLLDRIAMTSYEVGEGPDIDEENITDQDNDNNEVEIIDDSNEVPNQSESSSSGAVEVVGGVETGGEATSSGQGRGVAGGSSRGDANVSSNQTATGSFTRRTSATHIPPLNRQQQLLLPQSYEDVGDDSIVPSTPTLFVPRRTDGFGEAVSSPHVPSGRFTFTDNNPPTTRAGVAQVASEGMDDTRMDLSQLEDSGTGRSVPSTPLQVSPQDPVAGEVGQSNDCSEEQSHSHSEILNNNTIPSITITMTHPSEMQEMPPPSDVELEVNDGTEERDNEDREEGGEVLDEPELTAMDLPEESGDGVSSEGEKSTAVVDEEEGREAEASEAGSSVTAIRRSGTARRSARSATHRGRARAPPQRIVWEEDPPTSPRGGFRGRGLIPSSRGNPVEQIRGVFRGRTTRQRRAMFHTHYQPRF